MKMDVNDGATVPFEANDCRGVGVGVGVGVGAVRGEEPGVGADVGVDAGVSCGDTFQSHVWTTAPFSLDAIADTFHVPATALMFV